MALLSSLEETDRGCLLISLIALFSALKETERGCLLISLCGLVLVIEREDFFFVSLDCRTFSALHFVLFCCVSRFEMRLHLRLFVRRGEAGGLQGRAGH